MLKKVGEVLYIYIKELLIILLALCLIFLSILYDLRVSTFREVEKKYKQELKERNEQIELLNNSDSDLNVKYGELIKDYSILVDEYEELLLRGVELPKYSYTEKDLYLLAQCVEAEAGVGKNYSNAQRYVAQVVLNRVKSEKFPNTIHDVIYERHGGVSQFSVAYNGKKLSDRKVEKDTLINVYRVVLFGTDLPEYVLYFHGSYSKDNWVSRNTLKYREVEKTVFTYDRKDIRR